MVKMYEIYENHADRYNELICAEDYQNNLQSALNEAVNWRDLSVIEAGVGTGRVTRLYINKAASSVCLDRSQHMLNFAQKNLSLYENKLRFATADNTNIPDLNSVFDIFIEGWSFGHSVSDCSAGNDIREMTNLLICNATRNLKSGGIVVLLETLGTNVELPGAPHENLKRFYIELEQQHGFVMRKFRTDYKFDSNSEAARVMGFFFGKEMMQSVLKRNSTTIPEWTGIWTKTLE